MNAASTLKSREMAVIEARSDATAAKQRLLDWAHQHDAIAAESRKEHSSLLGRGAALLAAGLVVGKLFGRRTKTSSADSGVRVGKRIMSWALAASLGRLALRYALRRVGQL